MKTVIRLESLEQHVQRALRTNDLDALRLLLVEQHAADIADVIDRLDDEDKITVFGLLTLVQAADVLSETNVEATRELIEHLLPQEASRLLTRMSIDDAVEILGEDVPEYQQALLSAMAPREAREVRALLTYPARSAGRLMTEQFVRVHPDLTVADVLRLLRWIPPHVEAITDLYLLDAEERLLGLVSLRQILTSPPERRLHTMTQSRMVTVSPTTDQEEVARLVSQYDLFTLPVVDDAGHMLGIITVDDVIDVLVQENTEDVLRFAAIQDGATDESYFSIPIVRAIQRRIGWLLLLFLTSTLTINVLSLFEDALSQVVALSFFIPLLIGTGGNTGAQTVSTIVRSMALGDVRLRDAGLVIMRELSSGLLLGILLGAVALGMVLLGGNSWSLGIVVAVSVVAICAWANTIGALVPMAAQRFGLDPALVSAPLITTLVDATGLAIYLLVARAVLGI